MDALIATFFNIDIMIRSLPMLLNGLWMTLKLCATVIGLGAAGGLILALMAVSQKNTLRWAARAFIELFRALPPLVLLIFIYSGLPFAGLKISPFGAVAVGFFLNNSAYFAEIYRAGILSVSKGQAEASRATGLSYFHMMTYVVLPQAVRNVLPDFISNLIEIIKMTSLASVVSLGELLYAANMARSVTYNPSPLVLAAVIYLLILWPVVRFVSRYNKTIAAN